MGRSLSFPGRVCSYSILIVIGLAAPAAAADLFWDGLLVFDTTPSGVFSNADNWHDDMGVGVANAPTIGDSAIFDLNDTYTVTFSQNEASDLLNVSAGDVTFLSDSATLRIYSISSGAADANINGGNLTIGQSGNPVSLSSLLKKSY